jgi:hypothetical protein
MRRAPGGAATVAAAGAAVLIVLSGLLAGCGEGSPAATGRPVPPPHPAPAMNSVPGPIRLDGPTTHIGRATCGTYRAPVSITGQPAVATSPLMWVKLCSASGWHNPVELLVPGAGYDHRYFEWPGANNYVAAATAAGYTTAEVDMLGTGNSTHPAGTALTIDVQASTLHQLISYLDAGLFGVAMSRVVLAGHSVGGYTAWIEAGRYHDPTLAGLILLDAAHSRQANWVAKIQAAQHDAGTDPRFAAQPWATDGYMAVAAGARCGLYYWPAGTPAGTCGRDEATFATTAIPIGELTSLAAATSSPLSRDVHVPVVLGFGDHDRLFCPDTCGSYASPVHAECQEWFPGAGRHCGLIFEANAGHDTNLHRDARGFYQRINDWLGREVN